MSTKNSQPPSDSDFDIALDLLNEMLKLDPHATQSLFSIRVSCNQELADHPTIITFGGPCRNSEDNAVSFLGVLNGIFNLNSNRRIAAKYDKKTGEIVGFKEYERH